MRHTVPRLDTPDYILSFGSIDISVRQFLLLILSLLVSVNVWMSLSWMNDGFTSVLFWFLIVFPVVVAIAFGWVKIQGKSLEYRVMAMLRYLKMPRVYVWQRED